MIIISFLKFFVPIIVFFYVLFGKPLLISFKQTIIDGVAVSVGIRGGRFWFKKRTGGVTSIRIRFQSKCLFWLGPENTIIRLMNRWGLNKPITTGDLLFDNVVVAACDHPAFLVLLRFNQDLRKRLVEQFRQQGCKSIEYEGNSILFKYKGDVRDDPLVLNDCVAIYQALEPLKNLRNEDPFAFKSLWVEASLTALATWSFLSIYQVAIFENVSKNGPFLHGFGLGFLLSFVGIFGIARYFSNSSRGPQLIAKNTTLTAFIFFPLFGLALLTQTNTSLDSGTPYQVNAIVQNKYLTHHRSSTYYHINILVTSNPGIVNIARSTSLELDQYVYNELQPGNTVEITVHQGFLNFPWATHLKKIDPPPASLTYPLRY